MSARRVDVIGGGPGGLYVARLLKIGRPDWDLTVHERMTGSAETFGFGVGLTMSTVTNLENADPVSAEGIREVSWSGHGLRLLGQGSSVDLHGARNLSIARSSMLQVLARHAEDAGVVIRSGSQVEAAALDSDIVIAADGVRSRTREKLGDQLGASVDVGRGMYLWCGSDVALQDAIFSPVRTTEGLFDAHAYPYAADRSTFLIEADPASWRAAGLDVTDAAVGDGDSDEASLRYLEEAFADDLQGHPLLGNRSRWSRFDTVHLNRWSHGNTVLIGDAAHTAHYTLGSGTKLALEDAIALSSALLAEDDIGAAFAAYEQSRRPGVERFQHLAARSQRWWESYHLRVDQPLAQLAVGFMTRAGNIDLDRFTESHPDVVAEAVTSWAGATPPSAVDLNDWILAQPYEAGSIRTESRVLSENAVDFPTVSIEVSVTDPWSSEADALVADVRVQCAAGTAIWLHGPAYPAAVQGRIDLAERLKLDLDATVAVDLPRTYRNDAAAALVSVRLDIADFG